MKFLYNFGGKNRNPSCITDLMRHLELWMQLNNEVRLTWRLTKASSMDRREDWNSDMKMIFHEDWKCCYGLQDISLIIQVYTNWLCQKGHSFYSILNKICHFSVKLRVIFCLWNLEKGKRCAKNARKSIACFSR